MAGSDQQPALPGKLTAADRELIATARELAAPESAVGLRHYLRKRGHDLDPWRATHEFVYRAGFHSAQDLLRQLADLAERLGDRSTG
jgi:hypothetical protein